MAFYKQDIVDINLNTVNIHRSFLNHAIGYKNDDADRFGIRTFRDGEPVDLTGVSCQAVFMAPDGSNIALTSYGTVSGNVAYVTLPPACYNYEGQFCLSIQLVGGGVTGTMRIVDGVVVNTGASGTVAPTSAVPTYQEIIAQYDAMVAATAAANGAIAPLYANLTFPVKTGQYAIVDGALKRAIVDIATSEAYTAAHWTDAKIGPDVCDLKSAFSGFSDTAGIAIVGGGSASKGNLSITANGNVITLDGSDGTSSFFEIDSGVDKIAGMTSALNRTRLKANRKYRFTVTKISGSYGSNDNYVTFVIADGASSSLYDIPGNGGSIEFSFTSDKNISIINYVRYGTTVSSLVVRVSLVDVTTELTANSAENKATSALNFFEETEIKNTYASGQNNVTSNYRYFPDNIIPYRSILEDVTVYIGASNAGSFVTLEVWELSDDGTTLTRLSTKTLSNPTANTNLTIPVNAYNKKRRMISFCKSGCYVYTSNESVAGNGLYYTSDNSSTTLTVSSMTSRSAQKVSYSMKYIATDQTEYLRNYGERITNSNYSTILPDLNNAPQNVIFDIFQCLQSISNIPSSISSSFTSATFFSVKGDTQNSKNWIVQFIVPNGTETKVYVRNHMDGSWKAWKELGGVPQDANIMERDYYVATCVNKAEINIDSTKTILTFGDSITAGNTDTSWTYHFADMIGCTINNKAVAGSTFGESISEKWISTQISGVSSAEWDAADYVIVSAGTNDGVHNTPADELKTKVQAAITAIRAETDVPIIFITPIRRNTPAYSETLKLPYISGIITNVAVSNECNVICGFDFPIASETNGQITNLTRDGLHPNATGANVFARSVINALW